MRKLWADTASLSRQDKKIVATNRTVKPNDNQHNFFFISNLRFPFSLLSTDFCFLPTVFSKLYFTQGPDAVNAVAGTFGYPGNDELQKVPIILGSKGGLRQG